MQVQDQRYRGPWLTLLLSVLLGFASISTDFYLPALPAMAHSLAASQTTLELTVSGYLLGFGLGQLLWGPLADRHGRKIPLLFGIAVFMIGAAGCALSTEAWHLLMWRLVQALGASAAVVLARAIVRDLFDRDDAARLLSTLMTIMAIAPMVGPIVGAQVLAAWSWQAIFWLLFIIGACTFLGVFRAGETLPQVDRVSEPLLHAFKEYYSHIQNPRLLWYAGALAFFTAGVFAYVAGSSFTFISYFGLTPSLYGLVFASSIIGLMAVNLINRSLVLRLGTDRLLLIGTAIASLTGVATAAGFAAGWVDLGALVISALFYISANGFVLANAVAGGLGTVSRNAGSASAILGCAQYGGGMIGSALVGAFANGTPMPMMVIMALGAIAAFGCAQRVRHAG